MNRRQVDRSPALIIIITVLIGIALNLIHYPEWMRYAKPDWVLLILFYWCLAVPDRVGVGYGWLIGLLMDVLYFSTLGQHALGKSFVALIAVVFHRKLRLYDLWQQCIVVFIVASIDLGITIWISHMTAGSDVRLVYWESALTTCLLWPVVYNLLRQIRHRKGIS